MNLKKLRKKIDSVDERLVRLLTERAQVAVKINKLKQKIEKPSYSPERESYIFQRLKKINPGFIPQELLQEIFTHIMSISFSLSSTLRVCYLGPVATFTHLAALKKFGKGVEFIPSIDISDIFSRVARDEAHYGVVPVENSTEGAVNYTLDMFVDSELKICAEILLDVSHNLLGNCQLPEIRRVYSHPQVFAQCRKWLQEHLPAVELMSCPTTAKAAESAQKDKFSACMGSGAVSSIYRLKVLVRHIQDKERNITRFLVIGQKDAPATGNDKTSLIFSVPDRVGALYEALVCFKRYNVNLAKIESRPSKRKAWEYYFFVDVVGHRNDRKVKSALTELERKSSFIKILGSYPRSA